MFSKYTLLMSLNGDGTDRVYGVVSINDHIASMVPYTPAMVSTTILPFCNKIIFTGILKFANKRLSADEKIAVDTLSKALIQKYGIVESLPSK
jgi:hypothetical protein